MIISSSEIIKQLSKGTFKEECQLYYEGREGDSYTIEVHFNDDNYYEIDVDSTDTLKDFIAKVQRDIINERIIDLQNPDINRNNIRYFRKYGV